MTETTTVQEQAAIVRTSAQRISSALCLIFLVACGRSEKVEQAANTSAAPVPSSISTVHDAMVQIIIPRSSAIWELAGGLYDDNGNIDSRKLTDAQWQQLMDAAIAIREGSRALVSGETIKVAAEGIKIQSEGAPGAWGASEVQSAIDANIQGFKEETLKMAAVADELAAAADARDGKKTDEASVRLTDACGACHAKFWYPNQKQ